MSVIDGFLWWITGFFQYLRRAIVCVEILYSTNGNSIENSMISYPFFLNSISYDHQYFSFDSFTCVNYSKIANIVPLHKLVWSFKRL